MAASAGVPATRDACRVLEAARVECDLMGQQHIGTEHLLLGIAVEGTSPPAQEMKRPISTPARERYVDGG